MTEKDLRKMKVGDTIFDSNMGNIHRTIGGWIYQDAHVFVPFIEDKPKEEKKKPVLK